MSQMGWKVVRQDKRTGRLFSATAEQGIEYWVDEWTTPFGDSGPLCVFAQRDDAFNFILSALYYPDRKNNYLIFACNYDASSEQTIWDNLHGTPLHRLPKGTRLASQVALLKEDSGYD